MSEKTLSRSIAYGQAERASGAEPDAAPIQHDGDTDGQVAGKVCTRCSAANEPDAERCAKCQSWLAANGAARKHGLYAKHQPAPIIMSADALLDGLVADKGGADEMTTLQRSLAAKLRDCEILLQLNKKSLIENGVDVPTGRKAHDRYLAALDRFVRLAHLLGLERQAKRIDPLEAVRLAVAAANEGSAS